MKANWLSIHLGMSPSDRDKNAEKYGTPHHPRAIFLHLKQTINSIFLKFVELDEKARVIGLHNLQEGVGIYALIFINDIRFDLSAQTVVVDACAVPLCKAIITRIADCLQAIAPLRSSLKMMRRWLGRGFSQSSLNAVEHGSIIPIASIYRKIPTHRGIRRIHRQYTV